MIATKDPGANPRGGELEMGEPVDIKALLRELESLKARARACAVPEGKHPVPGKPQRPARNNQEWQEVIALLENLAGKLSELTRRAQEFRLSK